MNHTTRAPTPSKTSPARRSVRCLLGRALASGLPRRRGPARRRERGAALVIALFTLLAITGLGLLAVQTASEEIQASGNHRFNRQGERVSAGALNVALANVAVNGPAIWDFMKRSASREAVDGGINVADVSAQYTFDDTTLKTQFFREAGGDATRLDPLMSVTMKNPLDGFSVPGYSADFCFKRFTFNAAATVGTLPVDLDSFNPRVRYSAAEHHATGLLGPIECEGN